MSRQPPLRIRCSRPSSWISGLAVLTLFAGLAGALPLINGSVVTGTITTQAQLDTYEFTAASGEHITLRIADTGATQFTPQIQLLDSFGALVGGEQATNVATVQHAAAQSGEFTVLVFEGSNSGFDAGSYALGFAHIPGAAAPTSHRLAR
jgi:hypothetical protein